MTDLKCKLVDGSCASGPGRGAWGCYRAGGDGKGGYAFSGAQGSLNDVSEESYGGQDTLVEWRRGFVRFPTLKRIPGALASNTNIGSDLVAEPAIFGVVRTYLSKVHNSPRCVPYETSADHSTWGQPLPALGRSWCHLSWVGQEPTAHDQADVARAD